MATKGKHSSPGSGGGAAAIKILLLGCLAVVIIAAGVTMLPERPDVSAAPETQAPASGGSLVRPTDPVPIITMPNGEAEETPGPEASAAPTAAAPVQTAAPGTAAPMVETPGSIGAGLPVTVRATAPVDESYFEDAVFIGDSRTEGLKLYSGLPTTFWSKVGLNVSTVFTDAFIELDGGHVTVADAIRTQEYSKVYIMLGINELGWPSAQTFADEYAKIIDLIRETHPDATIYVQSIFSIGRIRSSNDEVFNNNNVMRLQRALCDMCVEKDVNYLNVAEVLEAPDGYLIDDDSYDGTHLTVPYYKVWVNYLKSHTV